ncbi:MAG: glycosyltransferase family 39 protein [Alphaproteobacteria bacterium]|nr:glycosyltransferase family 39 protein [Alphaproteobacteria bacterium]
MKSIFKSPLFLLTIITLFGAIARIWFFWKDGLHVDEKYTLDLVQHNLSYVIQFSLNNDCNPPLFYIIDWLSIHILGVSPFAERLPSVIFGILLMPSSYLFGKELRGETLGLLSALAVATLGSLWYYSQFGRTYMLCCLLFTIFCIYYVRLIRGDMHTVNWLAVAVCGALLAYAHLFAIIPLAVLFACLVVSYKWQAIKWVILTFIISSPLLLLFKAMLDWRVVTRGAQTWGESWYGAPFNQLIIFAPLEFFSYNFIFWIPMIAYSVYKNYRMKEVSTIIMASVISFITLLAVCNTTPVFLRYILLLIPVVLTIGLIPVSDLIDDKNHTTAQKVFIVGSFGIFYFAVVAFCFTSGLYQPKGVIFI